MRRRSVSIKAAVGRDKIMERLKLRAIAKKGKVLDRVELFKGLTRKSKNSLIMNMDPGNYDVDEPLCRQNDDAGCLFVLVEGTAKCMVAFDGLVGQEVHRFKPLDVFGESAVKEKPSVRTASIIALTPCKTIELTREKYMKLEKEGKLESASIVDLVQKFGGDAGSSEAPTASMQEQLARKAEDNAETHRKLLKKLKMMRKGGEKMVRNLKIKKGEVPPPASSSFVPGQKFGVQLANLVVGLGDSDSGEGTRERGWGEGSKPPKSPGGPPRGIPPGTKPGGPPPRGPPPRGMPPRGMPPRGPPTGIRMTQIAPASKAGVDL
jgi:CRP-like cAMP-binding protein